jgi:polyphenol oxidase
MKLHQDKNFSIYFGDQEQSVSVDEIAAGRSTQAIQNIAQQLGIKQTVFLAQNHGIQGMQVAIDDEHNYNFAPVGDYLFTQRKNCGIGVVTADCLPIVIYDPVLHAAGIVHAGWKGLVSEIFQVAIADMIEKFGSRSQDLTIYLGPAARPCCYEVQQDFIDCFRKYQNNSDSSFIKKDGKTYFDVRPFIDVIGRNLGIKHENIYTMYNVCTICTLSFCSYRRQKDKARRQVTMISLY